LIKMATAMALGLGDTPSRAKIVATATLAWLAVQAHLSALFVAGPLLAASAITPLWSAFALRASADRAVAVKAAAVRFGIVTAVVLILQIPYFIQVLRDPAAPMGPTNAISTLANPGAFRFDRSYGAVVNGAGDVLARQYDNWRFQVPTLIAGAIVLVAWRRDLMLLAASLGGIAGGTILFANWTRGYDSYWFLTLTTAMVLTYGMAVAAIPHRLTVQAIGGVLLAAILLQQPSRVAQSKDFFKYPPYRTMRIASYTLAAQEPVLRDIRVNFDGVHPTMDKYFIYRILGGRIDPAAPKRAFVNADGSVSIQ
jgi:hypothetical protein